MPSIFKHPGLLKHVFHHWAIFKTGWKEAYDSDGMTYDNDPWSDRSMAYDLGRDLRRWGR